MKDYIIPSLGGIATGGGRGPAELPGRFVERGGGAGLGPLLIIRRDFCLSKSHPSPVSPTFSLSCSPSRSRSGSRLTGGVRGLLSDSGPGADSGVTGRIPDTGVLVPGPRPGTADTGVCGLAEMGVRAPSRGGAAENGVRARGGAPETGVRERLGRAAECGVGRGLPGTGLWLFSRGGRLKETKGAEGVPTAALMLL